MRDLEDLLEEKTIANNTCMFASFRHQKEHRLPEIPKNHSTSARGHLLRRMRKIEGE